MDEELTTISTSSRRWDIFCAVVDNYGDIGTCWRLAQQLAAEYKALVRLWVDNLESFSTLCPSVALDEDIQNIGGIEVRHWKPEFAFTEAADVVIEAFACELPETYVAAMVRREMPPVWINLEYLSAETWVEECHLLASPHPRLPLTKYFFFPGFSKNTGGLLREADLHSSRAAFLSGDVLNFWNRLGLSSVNHESGVTEDEVRVSLFCYENPALPELLRCWADGQTRVRIFACPGAATKQVGERMDRKLVPGEAVCQGSLEVHALPFLSQSDYDRLLWACDVNFVRGEDSFVRAQWAQKPFVWQIYPQEENAHLVKLDAFLARYFERLNQTDAVQHFWHAWNGIGDGIRSAWQDFVANRVSIEEHGKVWVRQLDQAGNLADNLVRFVRGI